MKAYALGPTMNVGSQPDILASLDNDHTSSTTLTRNLVSPRRGPLNSIQAQRLALKQADDLKKQETAVKSKKRAEVLKKQIQDYQSVRVDK